MGTVGYTASSDEVASVAGSPTAFQYDLKGTSSFEQTITSSRENGTAFYDQILNLTFKKLDKDTHDEIALLVAARPHVVVEDNNGNLFLAGIEYGMDVNGGTNYSHMGTNQMMSVPYALYAENANIDYDSISTLLSNDSTFITTVSGCLLYTSPSPRDLSTSRMPSSA